MTVTIRETTETSVRVELRPGTGEGAGKIETGVAFLDHMLAILARYSGLDFDVSARGDLRHHVIEDVALTLGRAFKDSIPAGVARYGSRTVPMDEALVQATIDIGGRPYYQGPLPNSLYEHWMRSFSDEARATIHIVVLRGTDKHHIIEAAFKALGFALRDALVDTGVTMSTKGRVSVRVE